MYRATPHSEELSGPNDHAASVKKSYNKWDDSTILWDLASKSVSQNLVCLRSKTRTSMTKV